METNFTIFAMIESLKSFRELNEEESVLEFRFVREPGSPTTLMIESIERVDDDAGLEREKTIHHIDSDTFEEDFVESILSAIKDSFDIPMPDPDEDESELGDLQAEELFSHTLEAAFNLVKVAPTNETLIQFTEMSGGFVVITTLCKTTYNKSTNSQVNIILFQSTFPLCQA